MAKLGDISKKDLNHAISRAEHAVRDTCEAQLSPYTQVACRAGGISAIGTLHESLEPLTGGGMPAQVQGLGFIVPLDKPCPKGTETIYVKSPLNKKIKVCRLAKDCRRKSAPEGKPAHKGPLRRKKGCPPVLRS
jgi:hypothetical protein